MRARANVISRGTRGRAVTFPIQQSINASSIFSLAARSSAASDSIWNSTRPSLILAVEEASKSKAFPRNARLFPLTGICLLRSTYECYCSCPVPEYSCLRRDLSRKCKVYENISTSDIKRTPPPKLVIPRKIAGCCAGPEGTFSFSI